MSELGILESLEHSCAVDPDGACFHVATDARMRDVSSRDGWVEGVYGVVTCFQLRERAARLARAIDREGIHRGMWCVSDMGNCPAFVYLLLAAAIGGFSLAMLNVRLTGHEKMERLHELHKAVCAESLPIYNEQAVLDALQEDADFDHIEKMDVSRWIRRGIGSFSASSDAVAVFTSGTSGKLKVVPFTWDNMISVAHSSNVSLNVHGEGLWQLALPLHHMDGMEVVVRSLLNESPFILYRKFDALQTLQDAETYGATHVSVVDKMLHDMLSVSGDMGMGATLDASAPEGDWESADFEPDEGESLVVAAHDTRPSVSPLSIYQAILLGGSAPNEDLMRRAASAGARIFIGYGTVETCSQVASCLFTDSYDGFLSPLPGYQATVVAPDEDGLGQLAVKGPGVMGDYLNAHARFTADGYFLTGDSAIMSGRRIKVFERAEDMFMSGGENIYPEEIREKILHIPGVTEAYVFGDTDEEWGRRPVALVEMSERARRGDSNLQFMEDEIRLSLSSRLSRVYQPDCIIVVPEFPRVDAGKVDRRALKRLYDQRIDVRKVEIIHLKQPFVKPVHTAKGKIRDRESLLVRMVDWNERTGIGEDVAFESDWYLPETLAQDLPLLRAVLAPLLIGHTFVHPSQVSTLFSQVEEARAYPMACSAIESAVWDLYGKIVHRSIAQLIGARPCAAEDGSLHDILPGCAPGGMVLGVSGRKDTLAHVRQVADAGYSRVKLKVEPGFDKAVFERIRRDFPDLMVMVDAAQSFSEEEAGKLSFFDSLRTACIEEPLDPSYRPKVGPKDLMARLARLQRDLSTPICLDESWASADGLKAALSENPTLRCVVMKIAKFGGVQPALEFYWWARERGISVWMGDMFDTGVSKRLHAAFAMLPGMNIPGDINDTSNYLEIDITEPPFRLEQGMLRVNPTGFEYGLGCELDEDALSRVEVERWVVGS